MAEERPTDLARIADALEELPEQIASARRMSGMADEALGKIKESFERGAVERKAAIAERRANIAIALTGLTAVASLIAAIATLING